MCAPRSLLLSPLGFRGCQRAFPCQPAQGRGLRTLAGRPLGTTRQSCCWHKDPPELEFPNCKSFAESRPSTAKSKNVQMTDQKIHLWWEKGNIPQEGQIGKRPAVSRVRKRTWRNGCKHLLRVTLTWTATDCRWGIRAAQSQWAWRCPHGVSPCTSSQGARGGLCPPGQRAGREEWGAQVWRRARGGGQGGHRGRVTREGRDPAREAWKRPSPESSPADA